MRLGQLGGTIDARRIGVLAVSIVDPLRHARSVHPPRPRLQRHSRAHARDAGPVAVGARAGVDPARLVAAIGHHPQRRPPGQQRQIDHGRPIGRGAAAQHSADPQRHTARHAIGIGPVRHHAIDPAQHARAIQRALRPFQHLDPADIDQPQIRVRRGIGQPRIVEIDRHGRLVGAIERAVGHAINEHAVAPRPQRGQHQPIQIGHHTGRAHLRLRRAGQGQAQHRDGLRHLPQRLRLLGG